MKSYFRKTTKGRKPRKYGRKASKKSTRTVSKSVKTYVKRQISRNIENKSVCSYQTNLILNYAGSLTTPTFLNLVPAITQDASAQGRIGNQVNVKSAWIRGYINVLPYDAITNPGLAPTSVRMWVCRRKQTNRLISGAPSLTDFSNFFQVGSTTLGFQSNMLDMVLGNNSDYWTVLADRKIQLQNNYYQAGTASKIANPSGRASTPFQFHFGKHLGKLLFNDNNSLASNKELHLVFQTVQADGTYYGTPLYMAEVHYAIEWKFEDA